MTEAKPSNPIRWSFAGIPAEVRRTAEQAAEAVGMDLHDWLIQLIKYTSAIEMKDRDFQAARSDPDQRVGGPVDAKRLVGHGPAAAGSVAATMLPVEGIQPSRLPGIDPADDNAVDAAADHWRRTGEMEPILVRPSPQWPGLYEIIAGEERWQAARRERLGEVPVSVRDVADDEVLVQYLVSQFNRCAGSPLAEARICRRLRDETNRTAAEIAAHTGRAISHIDTLMRIDSLPDSVCKMLERGDLTVLHCRALLEADDPQAAAAEVVRNNLDIFMTEQMVRSYARLRGKGRPMSEHRSAGSAPGAKVGSGTTGAPTMTAAEFADYLADKYGLEITVEERGEAGAITLGYANLDQFRRFIDRFFVADGGGG